MPAEVIAQSGPGASRANGSNGAAQAPVVTIKPTVPVAPAPVVPAEPQEVAALRLEVARTKKASDALAMKQQRAHAEEKKTFGEKLSRLSELEKQDAQFKLNKTAYLEAKLGKDWYDQIVAEKINGGAPTADIVASELAKMEEKFEAKLAAKDAEQRKAQDAAQAQAVTQAERQLAAEGGQFFKSKSADFPLVADLGTPEQVGAELARRLKTHFHATTQRDESGQILMDGEILSLQKIAESWEGSLVALAKKAAAHAKYAEQFKPNAAPKSAAQPVERRTLSNDLTGSTPSREPPRSDAERRERALNAWQNARKPST